MNALRIGFPSVVLILAGSFIAGAAQGRSVDPQTDDQIEEIQVTATRRATSRQEISSALTVVAADEIAQAKLLTDALAAKPGVFLQQTTPGQGAAIIRGLKGSEVLHLVDGMRLNNAIFRNAPTQYMALVAPGTLERVEIVRGAPAALYGSDAVGGVVQALSRQPGMNGEGLFGDIFLGVDSADLGKIVRGSIESAGPAGALLLSGEYLDTGHRRTGGGERVVPSAYTSRGGRIAYATGDNERADWLFDLQFAEQPRTPRVDELVPGFGQTEPSSSEFYFAPNSRTFAHVRHRRQSWLLDANWRFDLGWQRITDDRISRAFESDTRNYEQNRSDLFGFTASADGEWAKGTWIVGAEWYFDEVRSSRTEEDLLTGISTNVVSRFPDGSEMDQSAVFGSFIYDLSDRISLSAGLRWTVVSIDLPSVNGVAATGIEQDDPSADLGFVFDLTGDSQLTANLSFGFRAPNVFDLGTLGERPGNRFNIPNPFLDSEHITQFDFGYRRFGDDWSLDVVGFVLHYDDRITSVQTGAITSAGRNIIQSRNVEEADIYGIELGGSITLGENLAANFVLNALRGEESGVDGLAVPGDRIPPLNGRLGFRWQASSTLDIEPYLVFAASQDRLSPRDIDDSRIDPNGTPGWTTLNLRARLVPDERWLVTAGVENLLDKNYRIHGSGIDAVGVNLFATIQAQF